MKRISIIMLATLITSAQAEEKTMKHNLQDEVKLSAVAKTVKVLSNPSFKLIGLGFKKDQVLEKHVTPTPAILIVQSGLVDFNISGKTYSLKTGDFFEIPANVEHEVVGKEDSHLYLVK